MSNGVEKLRNVFYLGQIALGAIFLVGLFYFGRRRPESGFRVREADRWQPEGARLPSLRTGRVVKPGSRKGARAEPLKLTGIRVDGPPHEILGIAPGASEQEIHRAHRELIKRYHPDVVGPPGSREWKDAQRIAEALNHAKDQLLRAYKKGGPSSR
jgi:hypothetical protein